MSTPQESRKQLLQRIREDTRKKGRMLFRDIRQLEKKQRMYFGPGVDVVDVLIASEDLGWIQIDPRSKSVYFREITKPQTRRTYTGKNGNEAAQ
jgi:hypothetical protein